MPSPFPGMDPYLEAHWGDVHTVTGIEFVSPGNKIGKAPRKQYRAKRDDLLRGRANVVEIDLTREGPYILAVPNMRVPPDYRTPYRVCVSRAALGDRHEVYRLPLQEKLPTIRIPLRPGEADVRLNLQGLVTMAWERGAYDDIDYRAEPEPPLRGTDAAWSDALLREKGLR